MGRFRFLGRRMAAPLALVYAVVFLCSGIFHTHTSLQFSSSRSLEVKKATALPDGHGCLACDLSLTGHATPLAISFFETVLRGTPSPRIFADGALPVQGIVAHSMLRGPPAQPA